ncbi:MAG: hypothetical protein FJ218_05605 [Ignavibacteria bacterium]|nr:hypothetical protein [Ignavibacteria bacterium]
MATVSGISGLSMNDKIDQLAEQVRTQKSKGITKLNEQKTELNSRKTSYSELKTKLNALKSLINDSMIVFTNWGDTKKFESKTTTSSDSTIASATSSEKAQAGTFTVLVERLAKTDSLFSDLVSSDDSSIETEVGTGGKSFNVTVNGVTTTIAVTIEGGETNKEIINKIVSAINTSEAAVQAQTVTPTSTDSRLYLASDSSGEDNAITFADVSGTLMANLGLTAGVNAARTAYTNNTAGFQYTVSNDLNSKFKFNGIDVQRSTNSITDLLTGVTLTLSKTQQATDTPVTITIANDKTALYAKIDEFISKYNEVITYLRTQSEKTQSSSLRRDSIYLSLAAKLRSIVRNEIESISTLDGPTTLAAIGITTNSNGTLTFSDKTKFDSYYTQNISYVADIFISTEASGFIFEAKDGVAHQLVASIKTITDIGGELDTYSDSIRTQLFSLEKKMSKFKSKVDLEVEKFRDKFSKSQLLLQQLAQQSQYLNIFNKNFLK